MNKFLRMMVLTTSALCTSDLYATYVDNEDDLELALEFSRQVQREDNDLRLALEMSAMDLNENMANRPAVKKINWTENKAAQIYLNKFTAWKTTLEELISGASYEMAWNVKELKDEEELMSLFATREALQEKVQSIKNYFKQDCDKDFPLNLSSVIYKKSCDEFDRILKNGLTVFMDAHALYDEFVQNRKEKKQGILNMLAPLEKVATETSSNFNKKEEIGQRIFGDLDFSETNMVEKSPHNIVPQIEEKKVKLPIPETVIMLKNQVKYEIESRQENNGEETVMSYAYIAQKLDIPQQINVMSKTMNLESITTTVFKDTNDILGWIKNLQEKYDISAADMTAIENTLSLSTKRYKSNNIDIKVKNQTQYEYMMDVSNTVYNIHNVFQNQKNDSVDTLIALFLNTLSDQKDKCQSGMVGRMFLINNQILNFLVKEYNQ